MEVPEHYEDSGKHRTNPCFAEALSDTDVILRGTSVPLPVVHLSTCLPPAVLTDASRDVEQLCQGLQNNFL